MADINVCFNEKNGKIKPLHGVNNGPITYNTLVNVSHYYKELGIPYVRLHDTNWPNPREVDIHTIFCDFDKDAEDPDNYDFRDTDEYIRSVVDVGANIVYRLGTSIEHAKVKHYIHPPADYMKWARICIGIIKHYNEGWANGFHYDIKYWEIWNEPDNVDGDCMWSGTDQQYYDLYKTASMEIKKYNPNLKVGGFAAATGASEFTKDFIQFCEKQKLPLDFFSWHSYPNNLKDIVSTAHKIKKLLVENGYADVEIHFNEWNYITTWDGVLSRTGGENIKQEVFEKLKGIEGAAFSGGVFSLLQDLPVDIANYYDGQPGSWWSGLFNHYGVPLKTFYTFKAFKVLYDCRDAVKTFISPGLEGVYSLATIKDNGMQAAVMLSGFNCYGKDYSLFVDGLEADTDYMVEKYLLSKDSNLEVVDSNILRGQKFNFDVYMDEFSLVLLKITKISI